MVLGIVFLLPNPATARWSANVPNPSFFRTPLFESHLRRTETVLILPYGPTGWSLLWQAEDGFRYRLVGGHFGRTATPDEERWKPIYLALGPGPSPRGLEPAFRRFLRAHGVTTIVVAPGTKPHARRMVSGLGITPVHSGDVVIYRLGRR